MLDWLKHISKEYPEFWKKYLTKFDTKPSNFIVLHTIKSGSNPLEDVIFSFGAITVSKNRIVLADTFENMILQYKYTHDKGLSNDFLINTKLTKMSEEQAFEKFIDYIGNATIVGYKIHHDFELINEVLEKMHCGRLKNDALDIEIMYKKWKESTERTVANEDIFADFKIPVPPLDSALEQAYANALVFLKLKARLNIQ